MEDIKQRIEKTFAYNPFARRYKEKNDAREEGRRRENSVPEILKRK